LDRDAASKRHYLRLRETLYGDDKREAISRTPLPYGSHIETEVGARLQSLGLGFVWEAATLEKSTNAAHVHRKTTANHLDKASRTRPQRNSVSARH